jgi:hypothetical protein
LKKHKVCLIFSFRIFERIAVPMKHCSPFLSTLFFLIAVGSAAQTFTVRNFTPITNYGGSDSIKTLELDYTDAFLDGFVIPSVRQANGGQFVFSFELKNNIKTATEFFYKLYYQNESYKWDEKDRRATSNFYGSWEDTGIEFRSAGVLAAGADFQVITDSFRIVGNPRNEQRFYGNAEDIPYSSEEVNTRISWIKSEAEWFQAVKAKAAANGNSVDDQVRKDAIYTLREDAKKKRSNHRWKRNPRCGLYSFLLVVTTKQMLSTKKIPAGIKNISIADLSGNFINPYSFFLNTPSIVQNKDVAVIKKTCLKVKAKIPVQNGIFSNPRNFDGKNYLDSCFSTSCNENAELRARAAIEQFIHVFDATHKISNVPATADVNGSSFTREIYKNADLNTPVQKPITVTACPCQTVALDSVSKKIVMYNPATAGTDYRKENVGIITRHGFAYGKFRTKVKLTQLLNKNQVWNGLTNAIWLYAMKGSWNQRAPCTNGGFIPKSSAGKNPPRIKSTYYSEIDIEIVKSSRGWPQTSYINPALKKPAEPRSDSDKIFVTATNWDLACRDAKKFQIGAFPHKHGGNSYVMHRWDDWYQAVTTKHAAGDDELFAGDYYWFEIEWKPNEIIWRMGPEKDQLKEFAHMDGSISNIPDNQMLLVITQEYHLSNWWPEAPFDQNRIPFPSKNIYGEVLEIEVE